MSDKDKFPYRVKFSYLRRLEVTEFFIEHAADMVILENSAIFGTLVYGFINEEDALIFKLKYGSRD